MKREDRQSDGRRARHAGGQRERERESSSFRSFCRCFASIAFSSFATAPEGSFFILPLFEIRRTLLLSGPTREERERLSRTRLNPRSDQRSFRRGEDSLTDNAILSSVVLLLKMISRHENWPREGFWTPVGTQCT